jgi:type II secretory pathway component PulF
LQRSIDVRRSPLLAWWPPYSTATQRRSLLRLIAVASEENVPIAPLLTHWAADERGAQKRRLRHLVKLLNGGMPLADAIEAVPAVLSEQGALAVRFDAQSGTRAAAVRSLLEETSGKWAGNEPRTRKPLLYFGVVSVITVLVLTFTQIWIVPQLLNIIEDFGQRPPRVVQLVVSTSNFLIKHWLLIALAVVILLWTFFTAWPGRFVRRSLFGRLISPWRNVRSADVLQKLAVSAAAGRPIPGALSTLARYHFDPNVRRRLLFVRNEVEQGAEVWQSMSSVGLLAAPEARLLATAERIGNRPWALVQLARAKRRRTSRRLDVLSQWVLPVVVLLLGLVVLVHALTIFVPLTELIQSVY